MPRDHRRARPAPHVREVPFDQPSEARTKTSQVKPETIQADFPGWRIWRGKNGIGERSSTCWVASLHDPDAGIDPTVVADSPEALAQALAEQRRRIQARTGRKV